MVPDALEGPNNRMEIGRQSILLVPLVMKSAGALFLQGLPLGIDDEEI